MLFPYSTSHFPYSLLPNIKSGWILIIWLGEMGKWGGLKAWSNYRIINIYYITGFYIKPSTYWLHQVGNCCKYISESKYLAFNNFYLSMIILQTFLTWYSNPLIGCNILVAVRSQSSVLRIFKIFRSN